MSASGRRPLPTKSSTWSICRSKRRRRTITAGIGRATTSTPKAWSRVDLKTGEAKWHFQFVHHPIWNFDMSSTPILADVTVDGRDIKVVAVPSKQGWLYVFDRATGEPMWPIVEKPVPQSDVPGEKTAATQPHPAGSAALHAQRAEAARRSDRLHPAAEGPGARNREEVPRRGVALHAGKRCDAQAMLGSIVAGTATNWPGGGYDPELQDRLYADRERARGARAAQRRRPSSPTSAMSRASTTHRSTKCSGRAIAAPPMLRSPHSARAKPRPMHRFRKAAVEG